MIAEHDRVVLTSDLPENGLMAGDVGTVVHVYNQGVFLAEGKHESFYVRDKQGKRRLLPSEAWTYMHRRWSPNPSQNAAPQVDPNSGLFTPQTMLNLGRGGDNE